MPYVEKTTLDDVYYLAEHLRQADINELAAQGLTPYDSLITGFRCSDTTYTIFTDDKKPMAIMGTYTLPEIEEASVATIWLLGTDDIDRNKIWFLRNTSKYFSLLSEPYDLVCNTVDSRNKLHINWLKWAGVHFTNDIEINGIIFHQFYLDVNFNEVN